MTHNMKLVPAAFEKIADGRKTIELRLNDEKRQKICEGDILIFGNLEEPERVISARVLKLHRYPSFAQLYAHVSLEKCGYSAEEIPNASADDMLAFYPREKELKYGALGIEIELI